MSNARLSHLANGHSPQWWTKVSRRVTPPPDWADVAPPLKEILGISA